MFHVTCDMQQVTFDAWHMTFEGPIIIKKHISTIKIVLVAGSWIYIRKGDLSQVEDNIFPS